MAAKLVAEEGVLKGLVLDLEDGEQWTIGRDPEECQLVVEDASASRRHALCRTTAEGIQIENLSGTNPVEVNEEELKEPRLLLHGDSVKIGSEVFRFYTDAETRIDDLPNKEGSEETENSGTKKNMEKYSQNSIFEEELSEEEEAGLLADVNLNLGETTGWLLKVVAGPNNGAEFSMEPDARYVLGTDPSSCDIVFQDVSVSRQHARLTIKEDETLLIEDMNSSNGTLVDGNKIEGTQQLNTNTIVSLGTTSFLVYDLEGERNTVISPLLPAIVKVLQEGEKKKKSEEEKEAAEKKPQEEIREPITEPESKTAKKTGILTPKILIFLIAGLIIVSGLGISSLFETREIVSPQKNATKDIEHALSLYPDLKYNYFKETGRLFISGHVLTSAEKNRLLYNLSIMPFIKDIDDKIIVDENIWQETNQVLGKNPNWRGIAIHSPSAGRFVISGYLQNQKQADALSNYLTQNFPYPELLKKRIFVDEEVASKIQVMLHDGGFKDVAVKVNSGEITLQGAVPIGNDEAEAKLIGDIKEIPGIRGINNYIIDVQPERSMVNLTSKYRVTGSLSEGDRTNVVIKGKILSEGDTLDGMKITQITQNQVYLEKDDVKYIIEYNR